MTLSVTHLVTAPSLAAGMPKALQIAAEGLTADRIVILKRSLPSAPGIAVALLYAWQAPDVPALGAGRLSSIAPESPELAAWLAPLASIVAGTR